MSMRKVVCACKRLSALCGKYSTFYFSHENHGVIESMDNGMAVMFVECPNKTTFFSVFPLIGFQNAFDVAKEVKDQGVAS